MKFQIDPKIFKNEGDIKINKITVFVDESGTLPDPKDKVIVVAAVGIFKPEKLDKIIRDIGKKGKFKRKTSELKFYTAGEKTKRLFFKRLIKEEIELFVLVVDKVGRAIADTVQNFALLCWLLLEDVFKFYPEVREVVFDRHFHQIDDIKEFNQILRKLLSRKIPQFSHVDSQQDKKVNVADMIAGAVLAKETGKEKKFYESFKKKIIIERRLNWPEAKRKLLAKYKKILPEPM